MPRNTNHDEVVEGRRSIHTGLYLEGAGSALSNLRRNRLNQHCRDGYALGSNTVAVDVNQLDPWSWDQLLTSLTTGWRLGHNLDRVGDTVGQCDALVGGKGDATVSCLIGDVIRLHRSTKCQSVDRHITVSDVYVRLSRHRTTG